MLIDLKDFLDNYSIKLNCVLHVGAHKCEERKTYNHLGVKDNNIVWIDANPTLVTQMKQNPGVIIRHAAISNVTGQPVTFNITNNGQSSSILPLAKHSQFYPDIVVTNKMQIRTTRLDDLISRDLAFNQFISPLPVPSTTTESFTKYNMINLDIQGVELRALKGLGKYLSSFKIIYTEVNVDNLYEGCDLLPDMDEFLKTHGFNRVVTKMTQYGWGDAIYLHFSVLSVPSGSVPSGSVPSGSVPSSPVIDNKLKESNPKGQNLEEPEDHNVKLQVAANVTGGIGNQLFILAHLMAYCWKYNYQPVYDPSLVTNLHTPDQVWYKFPYLQELIPEGKLKNYSSYQEDTAIYNAVPPINDKKNLLLRGYYQSERYFYGKEGDIREIFYRCFEVLADDIDFKPFEGFGIHVRRGDYLKYPHVFNILGKEYYDKARQYVKSETKYIVVSEDVEWCKQNIPDVEYTCNNLYLDFLILLNCVDGLIISNSTFSWWAAYLNRFTNTIIYPLDWFTKKELITFQRYYVKDWIGVTTRPNHEIDTLLYSNINGNREHAYTVGISIMNGFDRDLPPGWSVQEFVQFLNNFIAVAWYYQKIEAIAKAQEALLRLTQESKYLLPSSYQNLKSLMNDSFYHNVDLKQIPTYVIARENRKEEMWSRFEKLNLVPTFSDAVIHSDPVRGCMLAHLKALRTIVDEDKYPCAVFEDDVKFTSPQTVIKVPILADGFYLGLSKWSIDDKGLGSSRNIRVIKLEPDTYQLKNMLSMHGIIYMNKKWVKKCIKYIEAAKLFDKACDLGVAKTHANSLVFASNTPWVIQDKELNGQETETTLKLEDYIPK